MNRITNFIVNRNKAVLLIILIITIIFGYFNLETNILNHISIYFGEDDYDLTFYEKFQEKYGNEEQVIIAFRANEIFTNENLDIIRRLTSEIRDLKGVQRILSLTESQEPVEDKDLLKFVKIIPDRRLSEGELLKVKNKVLSNELLAGNLISKDSTTTAIGVELDPLKDERVRNDLLYRIEDTAKRITGDRVELHISGAPFINLGFNNLSKRDMMIFAPVVVVVVILIAALLLRNLYLSLFCFCLVALTHLWATGFVPLCGETLNIVLMAMPPVLLAYAISDAIHILSHFKTAYGVEGEYKSAVVRTFKSVMLPCFFTSITTSVGFVSFLTASVRPAKMLGLFTANGVMIAFLLTFTFLPAMLILFQKRIENSIVPADAPAGRGDSAFTLAIRKIGIFSSTHYAVIGVIAVILVIAGVAGMTKLRYETNITSYLPKDNPIRQDIDFISDNLGGTIPIVLLVGAEYKEYDFSHPESIRFVEDIQRYIQDNYKNITSSFSVADYYKEVNRAFHGGNPEYNKVPEKRIDILDYYELGDYDTLKTVVAIDQMETRLSFLSYWHSQEEAKEFMNRLRDFLDQRVAGHYSYKLTGIFQLSVRMADNLKESLIKSFFSALIIVSIMMYFICRSISLTIITLVPNVFPIVCIFGVMGWLNIPLDVVTIMIASITIGIAVDDTIHFTVWYRRNVRSGMDVRPALQKTFADTGKPIVITSIIIFIGFFILVLGSIKPTRAFGVLTAFSMVFALLGDLFVLPALISIFKPKMEK